MEIQYKENDASLEENQGSVCQESKYRYLTIQRRYKHERNVPEIRLVGLWLEGCGFEIGEQVEIAISDKLLMIRLIEEDERTENLGL